VVALAGVSDLEDADARGLGDGAVSRLMGGTASQLPERYERASPLRLLPLGVPEVLVHGLADRVVPPTMSEGFVAAARSRGDDTVYLPVPGVGHRDLLDPKAAGWAATVEHIARFLAH
jgi:dipeptidyl aminopeptidase/acylaminoacyl peptidase